MTELISQDDIDSLLTALHVDEDSIDSYLGQSSVDSSADLQSEGHNVKIYDFKSPDRFSKDQLRTLQMIYENYSRSISTTLSTFLRKLVVVNVASVDQISFEHFTKTVMNPSTLVIVDMYPLKGSAIMEIPPVLTFAFIERLLGGQGDTLKNPRELTDIELSVIEGVIMRLITNLKEAWSSIIDFKPKIEGIETNIQFTQLVPINDTVVLVTLETRIGKLEGSLLFCIPYLTLESIVNRLSARNIYISYRKEQGINSMVMRQHLVNLNLDLTVELGETSIRAKEIFDLQKGSVIDLDIPVNSLLKMNVGNKLKYLVRPGKLGKSLGVVVAGVSRTKKQKNDIIKEIDV